MTFGSQQMKAVRIDYNSDTGVINADGPIQFWDDAFYLVGDRARVELNSDNKFIEGAVFRFPGSPRRGSGEQLTFDDNDTIRIKNGVYTTCDPGNLFWRMVAADIELDQAQQTGTARQMRLEMLGIPIFYSPYIQFPTSDRRRSGFLLPKLRSSSSRGIEAIVPYYFNLAPNYDATITARGMSARGLQLQGEFRYLQFYGEGRLVAEVLPQDRRYGDNRLAFVWEHSSNISDRLSGELELNWLSDRQYLEELDNRLSISRQLQVKREVSLRYRHDDWVGLARIRGYQVLDLTSAYHPYQQLPQLYLETRFAEVNHRLNWNAQAELVYFHRRFGVTGTRVHLRPRLWFPWRGVSGFLIPQVSLDYTRYWLDAVTAGDDSPERLLPVLRIDGGLFMERDFLFDQRPYTQTLEPRIYYLLTPYTDQSSIPIFDTDEYNFNFAQLFRENRFSGSDRIGDANQLSLALTSRLFDASGNQRARVSIGQIRYLRDRQVRLASDQQGSDQGAGTGSGRASALVTEFAARINGAWQLRADYHYDNAGDRTSKHTWALRYQPSADRVVNASYRFVRAAVEQADLSVVWPLAAGLRGFGRFHYALVNDTVLEAIAGVSYQSCCWGIQAVVRHHLQGLGDDHDTTLLFQFSLKGLGNVGRISRSFIEQHFPGYDEDL